MLDFFFILGHLTHNRKTFFFCFFSMNFMLIESKLIYML